MKPTQTSLIVRLMACLAGLFAAAPTCLAQGSIQFNRDIRPILSENCFQCHGPDAAQRKAKLRLDTHAGALADRGDGKAVVPGDAKTSLLIQRVTAADPREKMPPPKSGRTLTAEQIELLRRWIADGAKWQEHWAFLPPQRPDLQPLRNKAWPRNPIDHFVLGRLEKEGLAPSPEAPRETLLRRVTLDLTGLPPTPQELDAFLADKSPTAYEKVVDRLLASPRHAERMTMHWLDLARYADTNGYNNDEERSMWVWRDWVLDAFQDNMAYDRFLIEQLAGDLLPGANLSQKIATGFNRNHVFTTEGGIIPEEYRVEYVADRVHTTATVFLGLSMQCARCHDHKYDPISQKDYYRFFAYFNNVLDKTMNYNQGAAVEPYLKVPSRRQQAELDGIAKRHKELETALRARAGKVEASMARWEKGLSSDEIARLGPTAPAVHFPLDEKDGKKVQGKSDKDHQGTVRGQPRWSQGKVGGALEFDGKTHIDLGVLGAFERTDAFTISAWVHPNAGETMAILSKMDEPDAFRGYDVLLEKDKLVVHMIHRWPDNGLKIIAQKPLALKAWNHVAISYDGSSKAAGLKVFVDGKPQPVDVHTDKLAGTIKTEKPLHLGLRTTTLPFQGKLDDFQVYRFALSAQDAANLADGRPVTGLAEILKIPSEQRTPLQKQQLRQWYLGKVDEAGRKLTAEMGDLAKRKLEIEKAIPLTMVMAEMPTPRKTHLLKRGQYDLPGEELGAGVPGNLPGLPKDSPPNRLGLARWLIEPKHPLTARVAVNRWWEMLFGTGIVETAEDFGGQGAWPSHPDLLDWLASELVSPSTAQGEGKLKAWDVKATLKLIVTSATYRQSSRVTDELLAKDPKNRLLARGPRVRLPAETVRDNALAVSGLLKEKLGGPSVKPYQPPGLWEDVSVERRAVYKADQGEGLYRRSMYTFWKRTCPPPGMTTFDAPDRETCTIRRARTNTPLQALALLNETTYLEAARKLAERLLREGGPTAESRLTHAFRLALARAPRQEEQQILLPLYQQALEKFRKDEKSAAKLLAVGETPRDPALNPAELAAWTTIASTIMNLDEAITKE